VCGYCTVVRPTRVVLLVLLWASIIWLPRKLSCVIWVVQGLDLNVTEVVRESQRPVDVV
jgi:hypothetical protein